MQNKYVFVDWFQIEAGYGKIANGFRPKDASPFGISLKMHKPVFDREAAIVPDKPWETMSVGSYATFIKVGDVYKCWYEAYTTPDDYHMLWCYAESQDGIHWNKPDLGLVEFKGSKHNNILDDDNRDHGYCVFYEEDAPASQRYKMTFTRIEKNTDGSRTVMTKLAFSEDGIHWTKSDGYICIGGDTQVCMVKNKDKYIFYSKGQGELDVHRRSITCLETEDLKNFSEPRFVKYNNPLDGPDVDYYTINAVKWPGCDSAYISIYPKYHRSFDKIDVHLQGSRDGRIYSDIFAEAYISDDNPPFDKMVMPCTGIIDTGNGKWSFFVHPSRFTHNTSFYERTFPNNGIFRAEIREDGFVSVHADAYGGFHTQPLYPSGDKLLINCSFNLPGGFIKAEIIDDKEDLPVPGFELHNCNVIENDKIWQEISWNTGAEVKGLDKTRKYRIRFNMSNADIYAYKF